MRNVGINLILADSMSAVDAIAVELDIEEVYPVEELIQTYRTSPHATYFALGDSVPELEQLATYFTVRRGVIRVDGKDKFLGSNVDWMTKLLVKTSKTAAAEKVQTIRSFTVPEEKDDPFEELGYARR